MSLTAEQQTKLEHAQKIVGRTFENTQYLLSAITHPSATEGRAVKMCIRDSAATSATPPSIFWSVCARNEGGIP